MRKDLKKASENINDAIVNMNKVVNNDNTPEKIKERVLKVIEAFTMDSNELLKIKDSFVM